jgi:hypothetical protein
MALAKNARTIVSNQSLAAAGSAVRGRLDMNSVQGGGFLTIYMVPAGTLGAQCIASVMVAHNAVLPATAAAGTDWKIIAQYGSGLVSGASTSIALPIDPSVMCLQVEFVGNTTNAITIEAFLSEFTTVA